MTICVPSGMSIDEIAADDMNVGKLDALRKRDDTIGTRNDLGGIGLNDHRRLADIDRQVRHVAAAVAAGQRVGEDVRHAVRRALVAHIAVIALGIDRQDAMLAGDLQIAAREAGVGPARALDRGDAGSGGDQVGARPIR